MVTTGVPDAFSAMGPQPGREGEPSHADLASGAWLTEPEQRPTFYALLKRGLPFAAALLGARLPSYAAHLRAGWEHPLSPGAFMEAIHEAEGKHVPLDTILTHMGFRNEYRDVAPPDPDAERKAGVERVKAGWAAQDAAMGLDVEDDGPARAPETARPGSGAISRLRGLVSRPDRLSQQPAGRRLRHLRQLVEAGRYADLETAEHMTPRRGRQTP